MTKFLENITFNNEDVRDLKELIPMTIEQDEDFQRFTKLMKVHNGDPLALIGEINDIGVKGAGCNPTYKEIGIKNSQKRWELGDWSTPIKVCYEDFKGTVGEYYLKGGTDIQDLTSTEIMNEILRPRLERMLKRLIWRYGWFGDKDAKDIAGGGVLTTGTDVELFNVTDGLWKKIFAIGVAHSDQLTTIEANTKTTYKDQKAAILKEGVATGIIDAMRMNADARITGDSEAVIMLSRGLADALAYDVKRTYKQIMPWNTIFDGLDIAEYDGVKVARVNVWDSVINAYENTGTKWNKPYRAVYANINQLRVATDADGLLSNLDIFFDKKERSNFIYAAGRIGTNIVEDDMIHTAY